MTSLHSQIESLLFMAGKPLMVKKMADMLEAKPADVQRTADELVAHYQSEQRGMHVMKIGQSYQMATAPDNSALIETFIKSEQSGELTKPSLETLTIIAYRGPITKSELEQIRGVNCSLILRNLLIRGLIDAKYDKSMVATAYQITMDFLEFLGIASQEALPEYEKLHDDTRLQQLLELEKEREEKDALTNSDTQTNDEESFS